MSGPATPRVDEMDETGWRKERVEMDGKVVPAKIYQPHYVTTMWFKVWALRCGKCGMNFWRFSLFARPRCPYCRTVNRPQMETIHY